MLQPTKTFWTMLWYQLCEHSLRKALFYSSMTIGPQRPSWMRLYGRTWLSSWSCLLHHAAYPHYCSLLHCYVQLTHHFIDDLTVKRPACYSIALLKEEHGKLGSLPAKAGSNVNLQHKLEFCWPRVRFCSTQTTQHEKIWPADTPLL